LSVPSRALEHVLKEILDTSSRALTIVNLVKGLHPERFTFSEHIKALSSRIEYASMKGPTFARPLLMNETSAFTCGTKSIEVREQISFAFANTALEFDSFDCSTAVDTVSALKNAYAILLGMLAAVNLSDNAKYALATKVFNEVRFILRHLGHDPEVIFRYCGIGDILLTGLCDASRNRTLGVMIGKGIPVDMSRQNFLSEGIRTVHIVADHVPPTVAPLLYRLREIIAGSRAPAELLTELRR
jgi:glycerol-3-phosphate dehydrogenase (NAD(P)+)